MTVGDRIKRIREMKGISQDDLAKRLGLKDKSSVCKIEKAGNNISTKSIQKYADALNTTISHLMGWRDENWRPTDEFDYEKERESIGIYEDEEKMLGSAGVALRIALYKMNKKEIQKLYDVAKIMFPKAFKE